MSTTLQTRRHLKGNATNGNLTARRLDVQIIEAAALAGADLIDADGDTVVTTSFGGADTDVIGLTVPADANYAGVTQQFGRQVDLQSANGITGAGAPIQIATGDAGPGSNAPGGSLRLNMGEGQGAGAGGSLLVRTGDGGTGVATGGIVQFTLGDGPLVGGGVYVQPATAGLAQGTSLFFNDGNGTTQSSIGRPQATSDLSIQTTQPGASVTISTNVQEIVRVTDNTLTLGNSVRLHVDATGADPVTGTATLGAGGTVTVNTAAFTVQSRVFLTRLSISGTPGFLTLNGLVPGSSFNIESSDAADRSVVQWVIIDGY